MTKEGTGDAWLGGKIGECGVVGGGVGERGVGLERGIGRLVHFGWWREGASCMQSFAPYAFLSRTVKPRICSPSSQNQIAGE